MEKHGGESKEEVTDPYDLDIVIATSTGFVAPAQFSLASATSHDKFLNTRTLKNRQEASNRMYYQDEVDEAHRLHEIHLRTTSSRQYQQRDAIAVAVEKQRQIEMQYEELARKNS